MDTDLRVAIQRQLVLDKEGLVNHDYSYCKLGSFHCEDCPYLSNGVDDNVCRHDTWEEAKLSMENRIRIGNKLVLKPVNTDW